MSLKDAKITQVMIPLEDFERGLSFYRDTLELPFLFAAPPQMAFFMCGSVRILVGTLPSDLPAQRGSAIYFNVPDIQTTHSLLSAKGVTFKVAPHLIHRAPGIEVWLAEFSDPDGNQLALISEVQV